MNSIEQLYTILFLIKAAADEAAQPNRVLDATEGLLGSKLLSSGTNRVLGIQNLYHGTSNITAEAIKRNGLLARYGGADHGGGSAINSQKYMRESKGFIHTAPGLLSKIFVARPHANLAESHSKQIPSYDAMKEFIKGVFYNKGCVLKAQVPYEDYVKNFSPDPGYGYTANASPKDLSVLAVRSRKNIDAKYIKKNMLDFMPYLRALRKTNILKYIKNNTSRASKGLLMLGAGGLSFKDMVDRNTNIHNI